MSTEAQSGIYPIGKRVQLTADYMAHKAGKIGVVVKSWETGNHGYNYTYHILFDDKTRDFAIPENLLTWAT